MAQGGVATDKSPSPPKIEWPETNGALSDTSISLLLFYFNVKQI